MQDKLKVSHDGVTSEPLYRMPFLSWFFFDRNLLDKRHITSLAEWQVVIGLILWVGKNKSEVFRVFWVFLRFYLFIIFICSARS